MKYTALILTLLMSFANMANEAHDWFRQFNTLHSRFTQHVYQNNEPEQVSQGELWFSKPGYFRANYTKPSEFELVNDGSTFFHYDVELMQVTTKPSTELANEGLIEILMGTKELREHYDVVISRYADLNAKLKPFAKETHEIYVLNPKATGQTSSRFIFVLAEKKLVAISAEDDLGISIFDFHDAELNVKLDQNLFSFEVPEGVDVLGEVSQDLNSDIKLESSETEDALDKK